MRQLRDPWVTRDFRIVDLLAQRNGLSAYTLTDMALYGYREEAILQALRHIEPAFSVSWLEQNSGSTPMPLGKNDVKPNIGSNPAAFKAVMRKHQPTLTGGRCVYGAVAAVFVTLSTLTTSAWAKGEPVSASDVKALEARIERYITSSMEAWKTPGLAIAIVAEDRLVYAKGFGIRKLGEEEPVTPDTVFEIGSTSKAFVAATQAIQVDDGTYAWNDRVVDQKPTFQLRDPWVTREFRMVDLLAQRSGLPAYTLTDMALYGYGEEAIIQALRHIEPVTSFRSSFAYQNAFHLVAGRIVASTSGEKSWGDFARKRLFEPLGMRATDDRIETIIKGKNIASGHRYESGTVEPDPRSTFPYNVVPAGGLNSSVRDMSQWLRLQINLGEVDGKRLVSRENLLETRTPKVPVEGKIATTFRMSEGDMISYANGWLVHSLPYGRMIEHAGSTVGNTAFVGFDPDRRVGVVVLSNLAYNVGPGSAHGIGPYVLGLLQGVEPPDKSANLLAMVKQGETTPENRGAATTVEADAYAGTYESPVLGRVELQSHGDGTLSFALGPQRIPVRLTPVRPLYFKAEVTLHSRFGKGAPLRGDVVFDLDKEGRPARFLLDTLDSAGQPPFQRIAKP